MGEEVKSAASIELDLEARTGTTRLSGIENTCIDLTIQGRFITA